MCFAGPLFLLTPELWYREGYKPAQAVFGCHIQVILVTLHFNKLQTTTGGTAALLFDDAPVSYPGLCQGRG